MAINPIQINTEAKSQPTNKQRKVVKPYLEAKGAVVTTNNVKPLPPVGHLVKDDPISGTKYFFKDIAYDMKALKDGFQGNANDHQLGRLNDVGLKLGGLGIATYLASRTTNPKAKIMEFVGLGAFLLSMDLYPKIAINLPARLRFGFDVNKEYIDDQGRKKSVMQDRNYIPYDMYRGKSRDENLAKIGDRFGIPKDTKNRNEVVQEQMSKTATQYNTLWMMTAGAATPIMTALACYGIENYVVAPGLEKYRNKQVGDEIAALLRDSKNMSSDLDKLKSSNISKQVEKILKKYEGQVIPTDEVDNIAKIISNTCDNNMSEVIAKDIRKLLEVPSTEQIAIFSNESIDLMVKNAKEKIPAEYGTTFDDVLALSKEEIQNVVKKFAKDSKKTDALEVSVKDLASLRAEIKNIINGKVNSLSDDYLREIAKTSIQDVAEAATKDVKVVNAEGVLKVSSENIGKITKFAKIFGELGEFNARIFKLENLKFEYAPETIIARYYNEFQNTLIKYLNFTEKEMDLIRGSKEYAIKAFDKNLKELCAKDEKTYNKFLSELVEIVGKMERSIHGSDKKQILNLFNATENVYNNTAKRLNSLGLGTESFRETVRCLVGQDVHSLDNSVKTFDELMVYLSGMSERVYKEYNCFGYCSNSDKLKYVYGKTKGMSSTKNNVLTRIYDRYQGAINSFYRMIHTAEVYNRLASPDSIDALLRKKYYNKYDELINSIKQILLKGDAAEYTLKFNVENAHLLYENIMKIVWRPADKGLGYVTPTLDYLGNDNARKPVVNNYRKYITRAREFIANLETDFTKRFYCYDRNYLNNFAETTHSSSSIFNLVGQSPVDMLRKTAKGTYGTNKWFKTVSTVAASILGVTLLAQMGFGKLSNPKNLKKQVNDDTSN